MKIIERISATLAFVIVVTDWASASPVNGRVADARTGEAIVGASVLRNNKVEAVTDAEGPGMITHMWFTGYVGHSFILRIF